jgi:hypothetical protein
MCQLGDSANQNAASALDNRFIGATLRRLPPRLLTDRKKSCNRDLPAVSAKGASNWRSYYWYDGSHVGHLFSRRIQAVTELLLHEAFTA